MNHEQFPNPNSLPAAEMAGDFAKDPAALGEALRYVEQAEATWVLDPAGVNVEQPEDQAQQIEALDDQLIAADNGAELSIMLQHNLHALGEKAHGTQPGSGISRLEVEPSRAEPGKRAAQSDMLFGGMLKLTGATLLREDTQENGSLNRLYKGMFEGEPVYFAENLSHTTETDGGSRQAWVQTEAVTKEALNELSPADKATLESIGVAVPGPGSKQAITRAGMAEIVRLYASANGVEAPQAEAEQPLGEDRIKALQIARHRQVLFSLNLSAKRGVPEAMLTARQDALGRMEAAELQRGRLFPDLDGYIAFENLSTARQRAYPEEQLDMGVGTGFEQGSEVKMIRSDGKTEEGWTFLGVNASNKRAEVARRDADTGQLLFKTIEVAKLRAINDGPRRVGGLALAHTLQ